MKTAISHPTHHRLTTAPSRGRTFLEFAHGAILLAGIISLGAALLLLGLLAWPIRFLRRLMGF
ncbi:hypothetical protein [Pelagibacterium sp.]|uniref:hypothetical protein n=1 Tax=Pelagibacterium sp. TaxID=1967288 RepID=UPI003BAD90D4